MNDIMSVSTLGREKSNNDLGNVWCTVAATADNMSHHCGGSGESELSFPAIFLERCLCGKVLVGELSVIAHWLSVTFVPSSCRNVWAPSTSLCTSKLRKDEARDGVVGHDHEADTSVPRDLEVEARAEFMMRERVPRDTAHEAIICGRVRGISKTIWPYPSEWRLPGLLAEYESARIRMKYLDEVNERPRASGSSIAYKTGHYPRQWDVVPEGARNKVEEAGDLDEAASPRVTHSRCRILAENGDGGEERETQSGNSSISQVDEISRDIELPSESGNEIPRCMPISSGEAGEAEMWGVARLVRTTYCPKRNMTLNH
ncbi:hypothetical protein GIB67_034136 [Kingdonia uniflora]|uniref:Uncharacterized protein n=1 Tax=Kingdonia uniflora TaxID=39325 RepID=A0A7J7N5Q2_9MAGN|nr:hypothetical protein GIB67_034136 [Kingdonia uniflora]